MGSIKKAAQKREVLNREDILGPRLSYAVRSGFVGECVSLGHPALMLLTCF